MTRKWKREWKIMPQKRIQKWIERIHRHVQTVCSEEVNGGNNYKEGREDFDTRQGMWKGFRCKGQLSRRVDMGTDPLTAEFEAWNQLPMGDDGLDDWEEFMSDAETEGEEQEISITIASATTAKRRRPAHQTEEAKAAWDEESRLLRNTRAREARLKKKQASSTTPTISPLFLISSIFAGLPSTLSLSETFLPSPSIISAISLPFTTPLTLISIIPALPITSPPFTTSPTFPLSSPLSPPSPPISLDDMEVAKATGRLLRLRIPEAIRERMWELHTSQPCTLTKERSMLGRRRVTKAKKARGRASRGWQVPYTA
jgi:hypothetical protein